MGPEAKPKRRAGGSASRYALGMSLLRLALALCLFSPDLLSAQEPFVPRQDFDAPLEVPGKVIHGAGQSINRNWKGSRWDWGDGRVSSDPVDMELYGMEMDASFYHHATAKPPVRFRLEPMNLEGDRDTKGRVIIGPDRTARLTMPDRQRAAAFGQVMLALRLVDEAGAPQEEGNAEVLLRDPSTGRVLAEASCKAREYPRTTYFVLGEKPWPDVLEIATSGEPGVHVAISSSVSPGNLEPELVMAESFER